MDCRIENIRKITKKTLVSDEKMKYFRYIVELIASNSQNEVWVVGVLGVASQKIQKNTLNFDGKASWTPSHHRLCPTTRHNVLSLIRTVIIAGLVMSSMSQIFIQGVEKLGYRGHKSLLSYPYMITYICMVAEVLELLGIDKILEDTRTIDLGLIRDAANPLTQQARQAADMMAAIFPQGGQDDNAKEDEAGAQIETSHTDVVGTSSSPPPLKFVPPRPQGMPSGIIMITQELWTEVMTRLDILEAMVGYIEGGVNPWLDL